VDDGQCTKNCQEKNTNCGKKWRETRDANTKMKYKKQVNKASKAVKLAKRNFEKQIAKKIKSDPKSFYSYVKSKTKFKSTVGPLTNNNGDLVGDYKEMAQLLNTFFASVFTTENTNNLPDINNIFLDVDSEKLPDVLITPELVHSKLSKLEMNKSPGIDFVGSRMLIELSSVISDFVAD